MENKKILNPELAKVEKVTHFFTKSYLILGGLIGGAIYGLLNWIVLKIASSIKRVPMYINKD